MHTLETFRRAITMADCGESKCDNKCIEALDKHAQTGAGTRRLLNNLLSTDEETYLEVGMYHGGSFASALYGNRVKCAYGIDMLHKGYEETMRADIISNTWRFHKPENGRVVIHFEDAFKFELCRILDPITVYLYDADHSVEGHRKGIAYFWPVLAKRFVLIVDDWSWGDVMAGTEAGLKEVGASTILAKETLMDMGKYYTGVALWLIEK
jgi:hypothetical protein